MKYPIILLAFSLLSLGCNKKETSPGDQANSMTRKDYLLAGKWQLTHIEERKNMSGTLTTPEDITSQQSQCSLDDQYVYSATGKIVAYRLGIKCTPDEKYTDSSGTWQLLNEGAQMKYTFIANDSQVISNTYEVTELNSTTYVYVWDMNFSQDGGRQRTYTYKNVK